jgi:hypothetical protein
MTTENETPEPDAPEGSDDDAASVEAAAAPADTPTTEVATPTQEVAPNGPATAVMEAPIGATTEQVPMQAPPPPEPVIASGTGTAVGAAAGAGAGAGMATGAVAGDALSSERAPAGVDDAKRTKLPALAIAAMVAALLLGLAGVSLGAYAVAKPPEKVVGPRGPQGQQGPQGIPGQQGPEGKPGLQGPPGSVSAPTVVAATTLSTSPNPAVGTALVARSQCPAGKIMLSGGASVVSGLSTKNVQLQSSFPLNATTWETVAIVTGALSPGQVMSMKPYVLCGASGAGGGTSATTTSGAPVT